MNSLYRKLQSKPPLSLKHVCEVGVYLPETSNVLDFIKKDALKATLVEADPETVEVLKEFFKNDQVSIQPYAMWDHEGVLEFSRAASSTFVSSIKNSPAMLNDAYEQKPENTFKVACKPFSSIDDGSIDLLSIDIEGGEWYVIKHLQSRPAIISVETHAKHYVNPFLKEILAWMAQEGYQIWYKDKSDTVFVHQKAFQPTASDRRRLFWQNVYLSWKRLKAKVKKALLSR